MFRGSTRYAILTAVLLAVTIVVARPALSATAPVRIMPLGDSITAGPGCWRAKLWNRLQTTGFTNIDFVGSVSDGGGCNPGFPYDFDHEGHGGFSATGIADNNQLPPWLDAARPDIVLMHLGTNDMWGGFIPTATKLAAFTKLVGQMRANNPNMKIIVAQIIPMSQSACATCPADVMAFDNALPGWAAGLTTAQSPIVLADLWTGFDAVADTVDGVHPNDGGFQKMANAWYPPLAQVLNGIIPPTSSPTPTASASRSSGPTPTASVSRSSGPTPTASVSRSSGVPSSPPTGGAGCTATYRVISQWGGAFQGEVTVKNTSAGASSAWTATFAFANGQQVSQFWNTALIQNGATVTARNLSYNGSLAAGASTSFGFIASWNDVTNAVPAVSCVPG
jgi:lysophospholipase L1-like esterase